MEFGPYQLQIFVSLVVILGAAFVALICDFLKGNNEQLRELTIELRVRREEEQRRSQAMTAQRVTRTARVIAEPAVSKPENAEPQIEAPAARAMAAPPPERKRTASADAMAAMERGAQLAGTPRVKLAAEPVAVPAFARRAESRPEARPEPQAAPTVEVATQPAAASVVVVPRKKDWTSLLAGRSRGTASGEIRGDRMEAVAVVPSRKNWSTLLARRNEAARNAVVRTDLMEAVAAATVSQRNQERSTEFPSGFQDGFVLSQLVKSRKPVSGLVVSIGVSAPRNEDGGFPQSVLGLIQSLIGSEDFACQSSEEEFLLIYPGESGASAQRRLSHIAQQLWDFQLRSLGTFSILFSWGGVEVRSESIDEAIASASERMQETRRGRKLLTMEPRTELRQAV